MKEIHSSNHKSDPPHAVDYESSADTTELPNLAAKVCLASALVAMLLMIVLCAGAKFNHAILGNWMWFIVGAISLTGIVAGIGGELNARHGAGYGDYAMLGLCICLVLAALAAYFIYWDWTGYGSGF